MNTRKILVDKEDSSGHFLMPQAFDAEDEVRFAKRRMDSTRVAQYADSKCGFSNTFDEKGAYLCGGLKDGGSSVCNKLNGSECLIRIKPIDKPHSQSCGFWETWNAGDPEGRYCTKGKMDDNRINFGGTKNPKGFSCQRCEYGQQKLKEPDSEGRTLWCKLKGHPVEPNACCADNDPIVAMYESPKSKF